MRFNKYRPPHVLNRLFILALLFSLPFHLLAQNNSSPKSTAEKWQLDATVNGVQFYHTMKMCDGKNVVFLKFNNQNNYKVYVAWSEVFTTQKEEKVSSYIGKKELQIGLGETKETDYKNPVQTKLLISSGQVNPTYIAEILKFDYKGITVSKVK